MTDIISRSVFTFEVLHRTDQPPADIEEALVQADNGNAVGNVTSQITKPVMNALVPACLRELGNDGTFFDEDLDEPENAGDPHEALFVIDRQQVEDHAGRPLTEEEAALFARTFIHTSVGACIDGWLEDLPAPEVPERLRDSCGCGVDVVWTPEGWQHDAAPYVWGDDHDVDTPDPDPEDPARKYWDIEDGVRTEDEEGA